MIVPKKTLACLCALGAWLAGTAAAAEVVLADGGKTDYCVVGAKKPSDDEFAAANDLRKTHKEITGADFSSIAGKTKYIYIGVRPECDKAPLQPFERRITTYNGDFYLYGEGFDHFKVRMKKPTQDKQLI